MELRPDQAVYAKFAVGSLRRRVWDAMVASKCPRCNEDHLRVACSKPRQAWEDDFERADFFTRTYTKPKEAKRTVRVQVSYPLDWRTPKVLWVTCALGRCLVDTGSDVSLARRDALTRLCLASTPLVVSHLGGETVIQEMGTLHLDSLPSALNSACLFGVMAVDETQLPEGVVALLGLPDIFLLQLSVDYVIAHQGCDWRSACPSSSWDYCLRCVGWRRRLSPLPPLNPTVAPPLPERPPVLPPSLVPSIRDRSGSSSDEVRPGRNLLEGTKRMQRDAQDQRTRAKIGQLFLPVRRHSDSKLLEEVGAKPDPVVPAPPSEVNYQQGNAFNTFQSVPYSDEDVAHRGKWYAVRRGRQTGVFSSWAKCEPLVKGFQRAEYKSFWTLREARAYVLEGKAAEMSAKRNCRMQSSSFVGGKALRAWIDVLDGSSEDLQVFCGLDSGSDVNLAFRSLLHDVRPIQSGEVFNCGESTSFVEEGTLQVSVQGEVVALPALAATKAQLPARCSVLLGVPGLDALGVMLDAHRDGKHIPLECFVGERTLRTWLDTNGGKTVTSAPSSIAEVQINPDLPAELQQRVRQMLREYEGVFAGELDTLPKPFASEPVSLKFVDHPVPQSVPEPRWTLAQKQILTQWAEEGLKNGSLELSTSRWASRPHIVMKTPAHVHKDLIDVGKCKLRVCGDYRLVNQQIVKIVPNLPTGLEEVEKAAGHLWYWETDAQACYSQFVLSPGLSREALAVWSPIGLVQPTTLPFGQKNSGTEAQGPYRAAASELSKGRHGNYVDDWVGYANSLTQLFDDFKVFLKVCVKYNITLGPHKTRFGFPEAQFFGFRVNAEGSHLALKHLDPIRQMTPPSDIHELRRVLGLFVVSRKYISDFATITKPMTDVLRGKAPVFYWMEPQQKAFDFVRDKLLAGVHLAAPNFELPFHLATDASEDGKGGELYQLPNVPVQDQFPYDAKLHAPDNHAVIFFISKAWNETQRLKPPFYLEGDSLLWGTGKCRYYALSSKYPLYTYSDHMPLNWMHKTEKGPISSFIIERLSDLETVHQYIQGKLNTIPDSCSRFPMLGPRDLAPRGYTHSVEELLRRLPASLKEATLVHFHGGENNAELRATLKLWFTHVSSLQPVTPPKEGSPPKADIAILTPRCEIAPVSVALYSLSDVPFALLLPIDLLAQARQPDLFPGCPHEQVTGRLASAGKITILDAQMVWVVGNVAGCCPVEIFSATLRTPAPLTGFVRPAPGQPGGVLEDLEDAEGTVPRTLEAWMRAQQEDPDFPTLLESMEHKAQKQSLWINAPPNQPPTIIVPITCCELLVRDAHERMFHLNQAKVFALLRRSYSWPTMRKDVRKILSDCPACELNKARQNTAHGLFSAMPIQAPRSRWCMDFQGQGKALTGETEALALIDPTSRYAIVIPLANREAKTWLQPFLDRIVFTFGVPSTIHSDAAPEFLSEALQLLAQAADIHTTTTLAHNARGNGTIEVFWRFWNRCLRLLPDDHYAQWPSFASRITFTSRITFDHNTFTTKSPPHKESIKRLSLTRRARHNSLPNKESRAQVSP